MSNVGMGLTGFSNRSLVAGQGESYLIMNPKMRYSRDDVMNLCAWIKLIAAISDTELAEYEKKVLQQQTEEK